jgi:outer membrane protein TolC
MSGAARPFSGKLRFREAIERGLAFNQGQVGSQQGLRQAHGQATVARSALLPNLNSSLSETVQQTNLRALGIRVHVPIPGFSFPTIAGPFNYFDLRARLTQTLANVTQLNNYRSAKELMRSDEASLRDARDLVVLGVGGAYLQVVAAEARVRTEEAQVTTAKALYDQASQERTAGVLAQTALNRSEMQLLTERQRLVSLENDRSKQKINLARLVGLPATDAFEVADDVPFAAAPVVDEDTALKEAYQHRADLHAAEAQVRAAHFMHAAARAERLPALSVSADYGVIGTNPSQSHGTFAVVGTLNVPIWQGGRTEGDIEQADAAWAQRRAELEDARSRVEGEVRDAFLDLRAASQQVEVARRNIEVSKQNLDLTRQRFGAGVSDNTEVVQAQQSVASAELDYIDSVFAHNVAKLSLARAMGGVAESFATYLNVP